MTIGVGTGSQVHGTGKSLTMRHLGAMRYLGNSRLNVPMNIDSAASFVDTVDTVDAIAMALGLVGSVI